MATPSSSKKALADIATHEILLGLARLHSFVVVSDFNGEIVWMSDELGVICGGTDQHVGEQLCQVFAALPGARQQAKLREQISQIQNHLRSNEILNEVRLDLGRRDGIDHSVDLSAFRIETQDGRALVVSIIHPARYGNDDPAVRDERDALGSILESSPDAVMTLDRFGFVTYANDSVLDVLGLGPDRLVGQPIALLLPRSQEFVRLLSKLRSVRQIEGEELEVERPDGVRTWVSVSTRRPAGPDGQPSGNVVCVYIRNVTDVVDRRHELERKNAELESYVHSVSHDLRSPLVSLLGFTRLLRQDYDPLLDESGRHFTDRIEQAGRTMQSLIEDLLELSRVGAASPQASLVDPRAVLLQLQAELKLRIEERGASLEIPSDPPLLLCDRTRLYQLFSNLIGNSLRHMGPCEDRRIEVSIETTARDHVIIVADHGRGIQEHEHERIFDVFHSRQPGTDNDPSTGIGLNIVRKIAESHGGRTWVESEPGRGARFYVSLPRS